MKQQFLTAAFVVLGTASLIISCKEEETPTPAPTTSTTSTTATTATTSTTATTATTATTSTTSTTASTSTTSSNPAENTWTIKGTTFTHITPSAVWNGSGTNNGLMGSGSTDSVVAFQIWFSSQAPATGTYKIVSYVTKLGSADPLEVSVNAALGSIAYRSKDNGGSVTVTNNAGVISATVNNVMLKTSFDGTTGDSATITGNLTYKP